MRIAFFENDTRVANSLFAHYSDRQEKIISKIASSLPQLLIVIANNIMFFVGMYIINRPTCSCQRGKAQHMKYMWNYRMDSLLLPFLPTSTRLY